jgi:uracil phosphoribosyltransferase
MKFPEELSASPAARGFTLLRVRDILGRFGQAARVAPGRHLIPSLPIGHRHTTPDPGPYAPTFPPNRWLMPAHTGESRSGGPVTVDGMRIHVVDHPLVAHKLTTLRDQRTESPTFRRLADELVTLLAYEATRDVRTEQVDIVTPVTATTGVRLSHPRPLVVPILRAGLGMLEGMVRLLPTAEVGFLGMVRDEETLKAETYASRMPDDLSGRQVYVLDPMLATGGTLVTAIRELIKRGADDVTAVVLLAAPEGVATMERELEGAPVTVVTASVDERLNERGYIVPGLGDAGDRMYGTVA